MVDCDEVMKYILRNGKLFYARELHRCLTKFTSARRTLYFDTKDVTFIKWGCLFICHRSVAQSLLSILIYLKN